MILYPTGDIHLLDLALLASWRLFSTRTLFAATLALLATLLTATPAHARVFSFLGADKDDPLASLATFDKPAFDATMELNGAAGRVDVRECRGSAEEALNALAAAYRVRGAEAFAFANGPMGWGLVAQDRQIVRLLAIGLPRRDACLIVRIEQSRADFDATLSGARLEWPAGWPAFPGSRPNELIRNPASGTTVACAEVNADPAAALRFYDNALSDTGWKSAFPGLNGMNVYLKGTDFLCIGAKSSGANGRCMITIVHKRLKARPDA